MGHHDLPYIDQHRVTIAASRRQVWETLRRYVDSSLGVREGNPVGWLLATQPRTGFAVVDEELEQRVVVAGRHRFSRYRIEFEIPEATDGLTVLVAHSYAVFPGIHGLAYRSAVIGTRFHVLATRHMLRSIRRMNTG